MLRSPFRLAQPYNKRGLAAHCRKAVGKVTWSAGSISTTLSPCTLGKRSAAVESEVHLNGSLIKRLRDQRA